jgi:3-oxoadipate enol-lactonase
MSELGKTQVAPGVEMAWRMDDFTDGWTSPDTVILLHGIAESGEAFRGWVPSLARDFRVLRPDFRGYGDSTPIGEHDTLTMATLADDITAMVESLGLKRVHIVGTKLGAQAALALAPRQPAWLASLTLAGVLISPGNALGAWVDTWIDMVERTGVEGWARGTMPGRMGTALTPEAMEWWAKFMGRAPAAAVKACFRMLPHLREPEQLERIACPVQVIASVQPQPPNKFDQRQPPEEIMRWMRRIPRSALREVPADSYHIAATHPETCAALVKTFIQESNT